MAFVKYILHTLDAQNENPWENKAVYLLYTELVLGKYCYHPTVHISMFSLVRQWVDRTHFIGFL